MCGASAPAPPPPAPPPPPAASLVVPAQQIVEGPAGSFGPKAAGAGDELVRNPGTLGAAGRSSPTAHTLLGG